MASGNIFSGSNLDDILGDNIEFGLHGDFEAQTNIWMQFLCHYIQANLVFQYIVIKM